MILQWFQQLESSTDRFDQAIVAVIYLWAGMLVVPVLFLTLWAIFWCGSFVEDLIGKR